MECPKCNKTILGISEKCSSCGYRYDGEIYSRLAAYFELKNNLDHLRSVEAGFQSGLLKLSQQVELFEALLADDLNALSQNEPSPESLRIPQEKDTGKKFESAIKTEPTERKKAEPAAAQARKTPQGLPKTPKTREDSSGFEVHFGQKWLLIIGVVTMIFGIGYFLKYSFEQGWVGPAGRVAMAYAWGIIFLIAGNQFRKRFENYGLYLIGGGVAILYFSTFAAFQIYHLLGQTPSFLVMILITVLASALAIIYDTKWLAVLGIIGGFLTPMMLSTGQDNQIALMTYMTILNLGLLSVAFYKKWDLLNALGFVFTYLLYTAWFMNHYAETKFWPAIIFLNIFYLIYSIIPFAYQFFRLSSEKIEGFVIITPNSFITFGFSYFMIQQHFSLEWVSVISIFYAAVFLLMATYLFKEGRQDQEAFAVLLAKSGLFLIITVPIIFSKHWITIFWAAQALALLWTGIRLLKTGIIAGAYILLALAIWKFLGYDYKQVFLFSEISGSIQNSYGYLIAERYITSIFLLCAVYWAAALARHASLRLTVSANSRQNDSAVILAVWGTLTFIILNVETTAFFHDYLPQARFAAMSVLWTIFSVVLMVTGFRDNSPLLRKASLALFAVTLMKVFLFDMSNISTPYRIISFIILGLMLVGTSYLYYRFKNRIMVALSEDRKEP
ncbi:MAG: DUF2339 domain-containing protein [Nitrospirae bacterium]|nr:DUF2339 domain-containing protein [Nitrospirota bacterium]